LHRYKKLNVWKRSLTLATEIYEVTSKFPQEEKYGLVSQLRRCVVSIGSNIAEVTGRNSKKDFQRFVNIAYSSSCELETQLIIAKNIELASSTDSKRLFNNINGLQKMIYTFSKKLDQ